METVKLRPGLVAELFVGEMFEKRAKTRLDYKVQFDWRHGPPAAGMPGDHFSIRWQGWLIPPRAGKYTLTVIFDDGASLFVDGQSVLDSWLTLGRHSKQIELSAKPHAIRLDYHDSIGLAYVHLLWSLDGGFKEQTIPLDSLYHDSKQERLLMP